MSQYPNEKSNNPYQQWQQPAETPYGGAQYPSQGQYPPQEHYPPQGQYQTPSGPPPAYGQQPPYTPRDGGDVRSPFPYQGFGQQQQAYQPPPGPPQGYQSQPSTAYHDQKGPGGYQPYQQGPSSSYDRSVGGAAGYQPYQQGPYQQGPPPADALHPYYNQTPGAGPSPQPGASSQADRGAGGMSLGSFFGDKGPPPMWQRQPPPNLPYNQFPSMCLISNGKELSKGFPELPPPCQFSPHPFSTHDVTEDDWKRFLADVKKAGSLSGAQRIKSNVIPMVTGMSLIGGIFMTSAIERKMKAKNRTAAGDVVDHWNHYFFGPRRMEAILCQASERLSGREGSAPMSDPNQRRMANNLRRRSSSSSSDSSSDSEDDRRGGSHSHHAPPRDYRSDRRARRAERRENRRARKAERRERKARGDYQEPYQLFLQPA